MMSTSNMDKVHRIQKIELASGETIESYGYDPEQIIGTEGVSRTSGGLHQDLIRLWVLEEIEVEDAN